MSWAKWVKGMDIVAPITIGTYGPVPHLKLRRNGYNYIQALGASGAFGFLTAEKSAGTANCALQLLANDNAIFKNRVSVGSSGLTPTAYLHIAAGKTDTAQIKLNSGLLLATPQDGAIEYDGNHLFFTIDTDRLQLDRQVPAYPLVKTQFSEFAITDTSSPVADSELKFEVEAGAMYEVDLNLYVFQEGWNSGFKFYFDMPTGAIFTGDFLCIPPAEAMTMPTESGSYVDLSTEQTVAMYTNLVPDLIYTLKIHGILDCRDVVSGSNVVLECYQATQQTDATIVKTYSSMKIQKIYL